MAFITDSLRSAISAIGRPFGWGSSPVSSMQTSMFSHQFAIAAYLASGMMRKVISVPAEDRVREWRDWQADAETITDIEDEEKRLNIQAKAMQCEVLRGIGGGAMILITAGDHAKELKPEDIGEGGLIAVNVVSRWDLQGHEWIKEIASPNYREPAYWTITADKGGQTRIHPSRVVCFRGPPLPTGAAVSDEETFWGDSRLLRVFTEVMRSDESQAWFAALVKKAKLLRVGIPNLTDFTSTDAGQKKLNSRIALIAEGESALNAVVYDAGDGTENSGEKITDYQITWNGIPAVMDAFDQRVAAVSDIPFTRLMGRSPAGMNSTGQHDMDNWNKSVASAQRLELRPCLDQLDRALLPSAGVAYDDDKVTWKFAPLDLPDEKTDAETFKMTVDALEKLSLMGVMPEEAFNELAQNILTERQWMPGIDAVMAKIPEAERFAGAEDETDPSAIVNANGREDDPASAGSGARRPAARAANDSYRALFTDATPRPLYVRRDLKPASAKALIAWAKSNGFTSTLESSDMHVTVLYSKAPVDPMKMGETWGSEPDGGLIVKAGGPRALERFGEGAIVLQFASWSLVSRHDDMVRAGASHDFDEYLPHVTITYSAPEGVDLDAIKPFTGELAFGPEIFEPLDLEWKSKIVEAGGGPHSNRPFADAKRRSKGQRLARGARASGFDPTQPRDRFGRWVPTGRRQYIDDAAKGITGGKQIEIGKVSDKAMAAMSARGIKLKGDGVALDASMIRHTVIRHGSERGGQRSVTSADIASAHGILNRASQFKLDRPAYNGSQRFVALSKFKSERIFSVFEVRKKAVSLVTMWKRK